MTHSDTLQVSRAPRFPVLFRRFAAVAAVLVGCSSAHAQSFLRVETDPLGRFDFVLAVADLDGDGRDDLLVGGYEGHNVGTTADERLVKTALRVFVNQGDGRFSPAPELVEGAIEARYPIVVAADFNGDARVDLAIFDYGVYVYDDSLGYGNPPQLLLSGHDGRFRPSDALAAAVAREHERQLPPEGSSGPGDLHLKSATSGDIDGDGDIDLWVQSGGGANVEETFIVNNGDGTFAVERSRVPLSVLANHPPDYWGFAGSELVDVDNDGDPDLALGQTRDLGPLVVNQFNIVLLNDGTGHYPSRIELPHPAFNEGYTAVGALTHFDVNGDGFQDLLLVHERNDDALPDVLPFTGRYIQVLVNRGGTSFDDETFAWMGDQSATMPERGADGEPLSNSAEPAMHDVDGDGCLDLVMSRSLVRVRTDSPLVYRNDGSGRFQALPPELFGDFSFYAVPADVNGDGAIDFVVLERHDGPDGVPRTRDDFSTLVTQLNITPGGLTRCSPRVAAVGTLPSRTLSVGAVASAVVVPLADAFRHASAYAASSSAPGVAAVRVTGSALTVTSVAAGEATITVTASGADNSTAIRRFKVMVLADAPFRARQFLELRRQIEALQRERGRPGR